jgi:hypothetical protein
MAALLQALLAALGWAAGKFGLLILVWRAGRARALRRAGEAGREARDRQLDAAIDAPRTRADLVERVRRTGLALALVLLAGACADAVPAPACPPVKAYEPEFQAAFADQLERLPLPDYWALAEALADYWLLRRLAERCG